MAKLTSGPDETPVLRYAAFSDAGNGGNPAGIVLDASGLTVEQMQAVAADVGYSETAFLTARGSDPAAREYDVRYFTPEGEVPFCGHATIAADVALAEREGSGDFLFHVAAGDIPLKTRTDASRGATAALLSVPP
jgi:PhzF family phenazine biosynthesis protein